MRGGDLSRAKEEPRRIWAWGGHGLELREESEDTQVEGGSVKGRGLRAGQWEKLEEESRRPPI